MGGWGGWIKHRRKAGFLGTVLLEFSPSGINTASTIALGRRIQGYVEWRLQGNWSPSDQFIWGKIELWLLSWTNPLSCSCLGAIIQHKLGCQRPRQLCLECNESHIFSLQVPATIEITEFYFHKTFERAFSQCLYVLIKHIDVDQAQVWHRLVDFSAWYNIGVKKSRPNKGRESL